MNSKILVLLLMFSPLGHASEVKILSPGPERVDEYCKTLYADTTPDCNAPHNDVSVITFPPSLAQIISLHMESARTAGYFDELSLRDMHHGHLISASGRKRFDSPEAYFMDTSVILYHSAENNQRWLNGDQRPRSFLGWLGENSRVQDAKEYVKPGIQLKSYERSGTIYVEELVNSDPTLSKLPYDDYDRRPDMLIQICQGPQCRTCIAENIFYVFPGDSPGMPLKIFNRCGFEREAATAQNVGY